MEMLYNLIPYFVGVPMIGFVLYFIYLVLDEKKNN